MTQPQIIAELKRLSAEWREQSERVDREFSKVAPLQAHQLKTAKDDCANEIDSLIERIENP